MFCFVFLVTTKQVTSLSQTHAQTRTLLKTQAYTQQHHFASHWRTHLSTNSVGTSGFVYSKLPESEEMG